MPDLRLDSVFCRQLRTPGYEDAAYEPRGLRELFGTLFDTHESDVWSPALQGVLDTDVKDILPYAYDRRRGVYRYPVTLDLGDPPGCSRGGLYEINVVKVLDQDADRRLTGQIVIAVRSESGGYARQLNEFDIAEIKRHTFNFQVVDRDDNVAHSEHVHKWQMSPTGEMCLVFEHPSIVQQGSVVQLEHFFT